MKFFENFVRPCNKKTDCSNNLLAKDEYSFITVYNQGDRYYYRNETSGIVDTMVVQAIDEHYRNLEDPCEDGFEALSTNFHFTYLI